MRKAFSKIDLFGKAVLFNYKGNTKSKSRFGALLTIAFFGFIIWLVLYFGQAVYQKTDPKATSYESFNDNPPATPLNKDTFPVGVALSDPNTYAYYKNESIYTVTATTYKTIRTPLLNGTVNIEYKLIFLEVETCTPDHFGDLADKFSYLALDQMYCLKKEQSNLNGSEVTLQGTFESPIYSNINFRFRACNTSNPKASCGTEAEIKRKLDGGYVSFVYPNSAVDLTNNGHPVNKYRDNYYTPIGTTASKDIVTELQQLEINTDSGWLTSDFKTQNYVKIDSVRDLLILNNKGYLADLTIRLGTMKKHYNRSYTKVQDVVAQVNGVAAVAFTVLFIVLAPYARLKFYEALINEIFDVKLTEGKSRGKKVRQKVSKLRTSKSTIENKTNPQLTKQSDQDKKQLAYRPTDLGVYETIESTARKGREDNSLLDPSVIRNPNDQSESLGKPRTERERKEHPNFSHFKARPQPLLLPSDSQRGDNKPDISLNIGVDSGMKSPLSERNSSLLSSRKPNFLQPNFKILDYETHGQDLFEDMLKKAVESETFDKKDDHTVSKAQSDCQEKQEVHSSDDKEGELSVDYGQPETIVNNEENECNKQNGKANNSDKEKQTKKLQSIGGQGFEEINLSFSEYLRSFFSRSKEIKEKMLILNEGIKRIDERLDIFNLFKKLREFDKLKVLLLENEQFVLFESLPRPELVIENKDMTQNMKLLSQTKIKDAQFIRDKIKHDLILLSYKNLKNKSVPAMLDRKLFEIYDDILV